MTEVASIWTPWLQALDFSLCLHSCQLLQHPALFSLCLGQNSAHWRSCQILSFSVLLPSLCPCGTLWHSHCPVEVLIQVPSTLPYGMDSINGGQILWYKIVFSAKESFHHLLEGRCWNIQHMAIYLWKYFNLKLYVLTQEKNSMCLQSKNLDVFAILNLTHIFFPFFSASLQINISPINSQPQRCPKLQWTSKKIKSEGEKTVLSSYCRLGTKAQKD